MKIKKKNYLIIDGYNIINAWDGLKDIAKVNLEIAREKLVDEIIEYSEYNGYKTIVVFDAYNVKNSIESTIKNGNIEVVFTKEHQTADSYIEKYITKLSKYDDVKVATNDYAEQQIILGNGCSRISARELRLDIDKSLSKIRNKRVKFGEKIHRNRVEEMLDEEVLSKLEKIRKKR